MSSLFWPRQQPLLPGWPRLPTQLKPWGLLAVGSIASLYFKDELWPHTPQAVFFSTIGLALAGLFISIRLVQVLQRWYAAYQGPYLLRVLLALVVSGGILGLIVSALVSAIGLLLLCSKPLLETGSMRWRINW